LPSTLPSILFPYTTLFRSHDFFVHRRTIDLFPQREVFVAHPLLGPLAIVDVSSCREPPRHSPLFIQQRLVAKQKPAIPAIFAERSEERRVGKEGTHGRGAS